MRGGLKNKTIQDGAAVLLAGLALGVYSLVSFRRAAVQTAWILSPWLFPMLLAVLAVLAGAALLFAGWRAAAADSAEAPAEKGRGLPRALTVALSAAAYVALLPALRFVPATALFLGAMMVFLGERRWLTIAAVALAAPLLLYALFALGLGVRLP